MLLLLIRSYLKPVLTYEFFILDTNSADTVYYVSKNVRILGFSKPERVRE